MRPFGTFFRIFFVDVDIYDFSSWGGFGESLGKVLDGFWKGFGRVWEPLERSGDLSALCWVSCWCSGGICAVLAKLFCALMASEASQRAKRAL